MTNIVRKKVVEDNRLNDVKDIVRFESWSLSVMSEDILCIWISVNPV